MGVECNDRSGLTMRGAAQALDARAAELPVQREVHRTLPHRSVWVRGPAWDGVWMLNALWLVPLVLWLSRGDGDPDASRLDRFYLVVTALFWIGHRVCSTWLAYCTEAYRPLLRAQPVRFESLSLPRALDVAALDSRNGSRFPNAESGARSSAWRRAPCAAHTECATVGALAF